MASQKSQNCKHLKSESGVQDDQQNKSTVPQPVNYFSLFQYSNACERCCIALAIFLAVLNGGVPPIVSILYGEFCNMLIDRQYPTPGVPSTTTFLLKWFGGGKVLVNASSEERRLALEDDSMAWGLGCATFTLLQFLISTLSVFLLNFTASEQILRIQIRFFKSIVCKDMSWFDTKMDGNFIGTASENMNYLEAGIGGVIGIFVYLILIFAFGVLISLVYGWQLTFAMLSIAPISIGTSSVIAKIQSRLTVKEMMAYTAAGRIAEEVFTSIRTVAAFDGAQKEVQRYAKNLEISKSSGIKRGVASGTSGGVMWLIIYSSYAIAFLYGVRLIQASKENGDEIYTPAVLLIVFYGIFMGLTNVGFASAHVETFTRACGAAASIFNVINTTSKINPCSEDGKIKGNCLGEIEFRNIHFEYPSRPGVTILRGLNLKIKSGEIVAIVGGSGSGKSTLLQLIQRLYDPMKGDIFLDGENIQSLKVSWLRQQLGVVGQEPLLFATTIRENILYGFPTATEEDVIESAKKANAHDFIRKEIEGYDTVMGQKGSTLSGGQKQRIAIARALIRNPKILLLDEATSALDAANEKIVQAALDRAAKGRTTLIVTHRLSTIENADRIVVIANGVVAEQGTHKELFAAKGLYYELLQTQSEIKKEKVKTKQVEISSNQMVYDSPTFLPSTPRSRYNTLSTHSTLSEGSQMKPSDTVDQYKKVSLKQILKWNKNEWSFLFMGTVASLTAGAALPVVCVLFGHLFGLLSLTDFNEIIRGTNFYSVILVVVGLVAGCCVFLQMYCFAVSEMGLTTRLRIKAFESILNQDVGWFDEEKNKVGALCLRLTQDASGLQGTILSFLFTWKMTLVTLSTIPFVFSGVYIESIFVRGSSNTMNKSLESASKIASEVIGNIKAVACLGKEHYFIEKYSQTLKEGRRSNRKRAWLRGLAFAVGQTAPFFGYSISLWYGGYLVANENLQYKYVIMVSELLIFGAWTLGQCVVLAPSLREAADSAARLQYLFTRKPNVLDGELTNYPNLGKEGAIAYSKVGFKYPTRPGTLVLQNFNALIKSGQSVAIMGPSGSGKSTVIQLLLRYYDPISGHISINNVDIDKYRLSSLRQRLGLVSQEPVLFDRTIEENIAYGDNSRVVPLQEVIEAARAANIHNFIASLPEGYNTRLGIAGTQLSGGQKQRIAIARALVRNPQILLLDEATSALDPQSESVVQEALDNASSGRTTITIAHRLGAVRNADVIYVLDKGSVKESGTHQELMNQKGIYHSMHGAA
ncbi:hypothetical protein RUM44_010825 [Polyplax serrata]|uniref:Uncharacterized protein n=1 Tax=Polyplax serrata TaxID=468196 RepID=A0ABR1AQ06_POLSC